MPGLIATYPALLAYECAFNAAPNQSAIPPWFTDLSPRTKTGPQSTARGRQYELDINQAGLWRTTLENKDGALDPGNTASPYAPGVVPYRQCRIRAVPGVNALSIDQATAGEGTPFAPGPVPAAMGVSNDFGYTLTLAASGTAYQGNQVYNTVVPSGATAFSTILLIPGIPVIPGTAYAFSAQVRITGGTSTPTSAAILWYDRGGASISTPTGASVTPTAGSNTWNTVSVSATAPNTALSATLKIQIASGGSTSAQTTWQCDGLQWEQSAIPTPWQQPQTVAANLLPRVIATGSSSMDAVHDAVGNWFYSAAGTLAQATGLSPAAPTGTATAVAWTTPSGTTNASPLYAGAAASGAPATGPVADCVQVTAGAQYTASVYMTRASSADATIQVQAVGYWFDKNGNGIGPNPTGTAVTIPVGSWARATLTATAPSNADWLRPSFAISTPTSTTATNTLYATGWQVEQAGSAGTWYDPGNTYKIFTGFVERWPQSWLFNGTYGINSPVGVDALAAVAQYTLQAPFIEEALALAPTFIYPLNDPAGSTSCADAAGKRVPAPVETSPVSAGSLTFGSSITSTSPTAGFTGSPGPVATFANNASTGAPHQFGETFISLHKTAATPGPPTQAFAAWTRLVAFRCPAAPGGSNANTLWNADAPAWSTSAALVDFHLGAAGNAVIQFSDFNGLGAFSYTGGVNLCDGNWHLLALGNNTSGSGAIWVDGTLVASGPGGGPTTGIATDVLGCAVTAGSSFYQAGLVGDLAFAIEYPTLLTNAQMTTLYNSWRNASTGDSSGARAARVLKWIGWGGPTAIDTGQTASMGPATDLTGATALDAINAVALTEAGNFYASSSGTLTFTSRTRRYGQQYPALTFGERAAAGEWPYEAINLEDDPTHVYNFIQVTQYSSGQVATAQDIPSEQANFPRILQRTINPSSFAEAQDAANYLLQQYRSARQRVANIVLNPAAIPGLFAALLQADIGTRVRVMRRPPAAPAIQFDGFIESIGWTIDPDTGAAIVQLQCSPADLSSYWQLAALHTSLASQAASGQAQATIRALPDSAVNALAQSLPSGYQLVFDPGTGIAETMTLAPGGIPATTPGYTSATLTFTSNFANTHQGGAVVCEPLPANVTDPTIYDTASVLGAASCAVQSGGASGTNTITLTALADGKTNALGSDWTLGDLLWISPGTPNFEGYNLLTPNQSTAGEGAIPLAAGTDGNTIGLTSAYAGTVPVTASGSAWQGANVWQASVSGGATSGSRLIRVVKAAAAASLAFSWSIYVRSATTGANPTVHPEIQWLDSTGAVISTSTGGTVALTGGPSATWTRLTLSGTSPAGTVWASPSVRLDPTTPGSAWSFQADGLQWEQASSPSVYCTTPQILSVAASVPGYSSVQVTLNTNLINSHSQGDTVCDPLPPGVTSPGAIAATTRLAY